MVHRCEQPEDQTKAGADGHAPARVLPRLISAALMDDTGVLTTPASVASWRGFRE